MELTHNMVWIEIDPDNLVEVEVLAANFRPETYGYKEKLVGCLYVEDGIIMCDDGSTVLAGCTHYIKLDEFDIETAVIQEEAAYDSINDTLEHIAKVREYLLIAAQDLRDRGMIHDASKFSPEEKPYYDRLTPLLKDSTYMSDEYKNFLKEMEPALANHYAKNSHHPEHYLMGLNGMNLFDIIEMFFDWKSASERHANGNIIQSIRVNSERFRMTEQLVDIFEATVRYCEEQEIF